MAKTIKTRILIAPVILALSLTTACVTNRGTNAGANEASGTTSASGTGADGAGANGAVSTGALGNAGVGNTGANQNAGPTNVTPTLSAAELQQMARQNVINGLRLTGDRIFFDTDSYSISEAAQAVLGAQAAVLRANPGQQVYVAGNCDERGTREYNLALGARRAAAVRDYLVSLGVSPGQIQTVSYGKERPIDDRPNPDGWAINRNAHTFVLASS